MVLTAVIYEPQPFDEKTFVRGYQLVSSRDDGRTWDHDHAVEIHEPGRQIEGPRAGWPRTVQIDRDTLGTLLFDLDAAQAGGPGLFFIRTHWPRAGRAARAG